MIILRCMAVIVIMLIVFAVGIFFCYQKELLPLFPINKVQVIAPLRFVTEKEVEDLLIKANIAKTDFFYLNMFKIEQELKQNYWIDDINIARVWPDKIRIKFSEQQPLAYWNKAAIVTQNTCDIIPTSEQIYNQKEFLNLPSLIGNEKNSKKLCDTLANLQISIKPIGIDIKKLVLTQRGSWYLELQNDLIVLLGKKDIFERTDKFVKFYLQFDELKKDLPTNGAQLQHDSSSNISYIDMRYNNGLAIALGQTKKLAELMESA